MLTVKGQVSGWKRNYSSGHCYFSLKDHDGVLNCIMWASKFNSVKFEPEDGIEVQARGYIDIYPPQGKYQLYVEKLTHGGIGDLQAEFEKMVKKLQAEGLFRDENKKPLPPYPMRIAVVTSESAAALKDIAESISNRWPCAKLILFPAAVQGQAAAEEIAAAISRANASASKFGLDLIITGRGGGSLEDLWAFNEEIVARAIYASKLPVISAVGHEVDVTIADLVADARASTPTKAGMIAVPDIHETHRVLISAERALAADMNTTLKMAAHRLDALTGSYVFKQPARILTDPAIKLDNAATALRGSINNRLSQLAEKLARLESHSRRLEPHRLIARKATLLENARSALNRHIAKSLSTAENTLTAGENRLAGLNPKGVLERGFSITRDKKTSRILRNADDIEIDSEIITELKDRIFIESRVTKK